MFTPPDGSSPRMQLFMFTHAAVEVLPPSPIAGKILASTASFGVSLSQGALTGHVVHALDGPEDDPSSYDACDTIINPQELAGNIALIRRGGCKFIQKVKGAQDAGAIAVIVYNDDRGDSLGNMTGNDPSIVIPSVFVPQSDGEAMRTAPLVTVAGGVEVIGAGLGVVLLGVAVIGVVVIGVAGPITGSNWRSSKALSAALRVVFGTGLAGDVA